MASSNLAGNPYCRWPSALIDPLIPKCFDINAVGLRLLSSDHYSGCFRRFLARLSAENGAAHVADNATEVKAVTTIQRECSKSSEPISTSSNIQSTPHAAISKFRWIVLVCIFIFARGELHHLYRWRKRWDSNPRRACTLAGFQDQFLKPLGHSSLQNKAFT
jgi:hypothetical protein